MQKRYFSTYNVNKTSSILKFFYNNAYKMNEIPNLTSKCHEKEVPYQKSSCARQKITKNSSFLKSNKTDATTYVPRPRRVHSHSSIINEIRQKTSEAFYLRQTS